MISPEGRPIFLALADEIEDGILAGTYAEDAAVPSTNELALHRRINPATAGRALSELVDRGVVVKRRGIGMFVAVGAREALRARRRAAFSETFLSPLLAEAARLGLSGEDLVALIRKQQS